MDTPVLVEKMRKRAPAAAKSAEFILVLAWALAPMALFLAMFAFGVSLIVLILELLIAPHRLDMLSPPYLYALFLSSCAIVIIQHFIMPITGESWNSTLKAVPFEWLKSKSPVLWGTIQLIALMTLFPVFYVIYVSIMLVLHRNYG